MNWQQFELIIINNLSDDLLSPKYRKIKKKNLFVHKTFGHCYVVSEVAYFLLGGKESGWTPQFIRHLGAPHWFLKHSSGMILDMTAKQFKAPINYSKAVGKGFLTKDPSKRAKLLLNKINNSKILNKLLKIAP